MRLQHALVDSLLSNLNAIPLDIDNNEKKQYNQKNEIEFQIHFLIICIMVKLYSNL